MRGRLALISTLAVAALVLELVVISRTSALTLNMAGTLAVSVTLHIVERKLFDGHLDREDTINVRATEGLAVTYPTQRWDVWLIGARAFAFAGHGLHALLCWRVVVRIHATHATVVRPYTRCTPQRNRPKRGRERVVRAQSALTSRT